MNINLVINQKPKIPEDLALGNNLINKHAFEINYFSNAGNAA